MPVPLSLIALVRRPAQEGVPDKSYAVCIEDLILALHETEHHQVGRDPHYPAHRQGMEAIFERDSFPYPRHEVIILLVCRVNKSPLT